MCHHYLANKATSVPEPASTEMHLNLKNSRLKKP